jgi:phosphatidylglycerophosphate synthase
MERREVSSRSNRLIRTLAVKTAASRITPNQISTASVAFAALVPVGMFWVGGPVGALIAITGIQLRLIANVLDGLVAVEGGKSSPLGALYNEFPDRIADSIVIVAIGYACSAPALGWAGALLAALTAYVRVFGGSLRLTQSFAGPMAKQHRMAVATAALAAAAILPASLGSIAGQVGLWVIVVGSALTCVTRTRAIASQLEAVQ